LPGADEAQPEGQQYGAETTIDPGLRRHGRGECAGDEAGQPIACSDGGVYRKHEVPEQEDDAADDARVDKHFQPGVVKISVPVVGKHKSPGLVFRHLGGPQIAQGHSGGEVTPGDVPTTVPYREAEIGAVPLAGINGHIVMALDPAVMIVVIQVFQLAHAVECLWEKKEEEEA